MIFNIQRDSPVPIYEQIVSQVIFGIASGGLEAKWTWMYASAGVVLQWRSRWSAQRRPAAKAGGREGRNRLGIGHSASGLGSCSSDWC